MTASSVLLSDTFFIINLYHLAWCNQSCCQRFQITPNEHSIVDNTTTTVLSSTGPNKTCFQRLYKRSVHEVNGVSLYLNKGWPTRWHLLYYLLLNMFQTLIRPSSGACDYLLRCVGWLEACWCYVAGLSVGDVVSECRLNHCTRIPHHQQTTPLHNTSTPQVSLHNTTSNRKLLKTDVLTSETCWAVNNKANVI